MKRDFTVNVTSKDSKMLFKGSKCRVTKKSIRTRIGLTKNVKETLECDKFDIFLNSKAE